MKSIITLVFLFTMAIACNTEKKKENQASWSKLDGDCTQTGAGVESTSGCTFRLNNPVTDKNVVDYKIDFKFNSKLNSYVEFIMAGNDDLSQGITLRMQRDGDVVRYYIKDAEKTNQEIMASDTVDSAGFKYIVKHVMKDQPAKISLFSEINGEIFNTSNDLLGNHSFSTFKTAGGVYGFRLKNALVRSISH